MFKINPIQRAWDSSSNSFINMPQQFWSRKKRLRVYSNLNFSSYENVSILYCVCIYILLQRAEKETTHPLSDRLNAAAAEAATKQTGRKEEIVWSTNNRKTKQYVKTTTIGTTQIVMAACSSTSEASSSCIGSLSAATLHAAAAAVKVLWPLSLPGNARL